MRVTEKNLQLARRRAKNPFLQAGWGPLNYTEYIDAQSRIERVRNFNAEECRWVIALPGVQTTVRQAAERRLRKLEKEKGK
jgi:hypothetical protein